LKFYRSIKYLERKVLIKRCPTNNKLAIKVIEVSWGAVG
jgi:hypothetical protein